MGKVLAWTAGILAFLLAALVVLALTVNWTPVGRWGAERLSATLGREISLNGRMEIDWGWTPRITLTDLTVANAPWGGDPLMARVDRLLLAVEIPALLRGRIELPEVALTRPWLLLERNAAGEGNWSFGPADPRADTAAPDDRSEVPVLERLVVEDATLIYRDPDKTADVRSRLSAVAGSGPDGRDTVRVEGEGTLSGKPLRVALIGGPLLALRVTERPYPVDLRVEAGETRVTMTGTFQEPVKLQGADIALEIEGPSLDDVFPLFGIPAPITAPYLLAGRITRTEPLWRVRDLVGRVGESDIAGWLTLAPVQPRPRIAGELVSSRLRLADLGGFVGYDPAGGTAGRPSTVPEGRLLPDMEIDTDRLEAADMDLRFTGREIAVPVLPLDSLAFHFTLNDRVAVIDDLALEAARGRITGRASLDGRAEVPSASFDLGLDGLGLRPFFAGTPFAQETEGTINGRVKLAGQGNSLAEIMASADGEAGVVMPGGQVSHLLVEAAGLDVAEGLARLLGGDEPVRVRCAVADLGVRKGVMLSNALVFDTTDTKLVGALKVEFGTEALAARLEAQPKDASPLAGEVPITIGGTLAAPSVGVEAEELALRAGAAAVLGVVATPLAAVLPFIETGGGEDSPCRALIENARDVGPGERRPGLGNGDG